MATVRNSGRLDALLHSLDRLGQAGSLLSTLVIWLLAVTVTYNVVMRMAQLPTLWATEVSIYLMVAMAFLGAGATQGVDGHFRVSFVRDLCPPKVRLALDILAMAVSLLFALGFTYGAWRLAVFSWGMELKTSTILRVPLWLLQGLLLVGGALLTLAVLRDLLRIIINGHTVRDAKGANEVI